MRVEIFRGDNEMGLRDEVNRWLDNNPGIEIVQMVQSVNVDNEKQMQSIHLTFLYRHHRGLTGAIQSLASQPQGIVKRVQDPNLAPLPD